MITLCITAFNEEKNLRTLFEDIYMLMSHQPNLQVMIIDNGSTDGTWNLLNQLKENKENRINVSRLIENVGYGGGLKEAITKSKTDLVATLSADRQYSAADVSKVISKFEKMQKKHPNLLLYGERTTRFDSNLNKIISALYSKLVRKVLGINATDINGQPKIFSRNILDNLDDILSSSFFFDAQILTIAQRKGYDLIPCDVTFVSRKYGVSSWAHRKFEVYFRTLLELRKFRVQIKRIEI